MTDEVNPDDLMRPSEVAALFRVDPKSVTRWANKGLLTVKWTLGRQRRYLRKEVMDLANNWKRE